MMKKIVVLSMVMFVVGLGATALAGPGYHFVYTPDGVGGWRQASHFECEMFSQDSQGYDYQWESAEGAEPCTHEYKEPHPWDPIQFDIVNHAHLFPWIEAYITEQHLTWDIFRPGDYMAKAFIIQLKANCSVLVHLGGGTWQIPEKFVAGKENGHIEWGPFTKDDEDEMIGDKLWTYSLLNKGATGTPPDEIEVRWWWYIAYGEKPPAHPITDAEFALMPPKDQWVRAPDLNSTRIIVPDSEDLHKPNYTHLVFFEDLEIEQCDSEGKYVDLFAITITPDP